MQICLTHGAKKNVGDYLIHSRAKKLWRHVHPDVPVYSQGRWDESELQAETGLVVMCGGPGFRRDLVSGTFPIIRHAFDASVPVSGFALGWSGQPASDPMSFKMMNSDVETLGRVVASSGPISVRDEITADIAKNLGIESVMTGCSAWYSLPHIGQEPRTDLRQPESIVFTTPASKKNSVESVQIMKYLREKFRDAEIFVSFHRGIGRDEHTKLINSFSKTAQAITARKLGLKVVDVSYDLEKTNFYHDIDLHVGYRVHAHLDFVSRRSPSVLIAEDGRGMGQIQTLHSTESMLVARKNSLLRSLDLELQKQIDNEWPSLVSAVHKIEETYPLMLDTIEKQLNYHS